MFNRYLTGCCCLQKEIMLCTCLFLPYKQFISIRVAKTDVAASCRSKTALLMHKHNILYTLYLMIYLACGNCKTWIQMHGWSPCSIQSVDDFVFLIVFVLICSRTFYVK